MKIKILVLLSSFFYTVAVSAQDPVFTQYFMVPQVLNPGFTGMLETTNVGILHRTQWPELDLRVDSDFVYAYTWNENINSGFGLNILSQREAFSDYKFTEGSLAYAYRVQLTDEWYFRPAVEFGFGYKSYGFQNLVLGDQINIGSGSISSGSIDPLAFNRNLNFVDISAGMLVNNQNGWFGLSLKHINKPNISFEKEGNVPLDRFFSANLGYEFLIADYIDVISFPYETRLLVTTNYMAQGSFDRWDFGTGLIFEKFFFGVGAVTSPSKNTVDSSFLISVNLFGGLQFDHFKFGYSYDFNTTQIGKTGGVYEISIMYIFDTDRCYGCPKYY
nr:PorP/SprF family type IX secretion system membrane protein [uncultured Flavobacterium sp.]